jgi:hypothetical protein
MGFPLVRTVIPFDLREFMEFWAASWLIVFPAIAPAWRPWPPLKRQVGCRVMLILVFLWQTISLKIVLADPVIHPHPRPRSNQHHRDVAASSIVISRGGKKNYCLEELTSLSSGCVMFATVLCLYLCYIYNSRWLLYAIWQGEVIVLRISLAHSSRCVMFATELCLDQCYIYNSRVVVAEEKGE